MSSPVSLLVENPSVRAAAFDLLRALDRWAMPADPDRDGDAEEQAVEDAEEVVEKFVDAMTAFQQASKARRLRKRKGGAR